MTDRPPGPSGLPVVGSTLSFVRDPFATYERWAAEYGDVVGADIAGHDFVMVAHPDQIETVLVEDQDRYGKGEFQRSQLGDIVGDGLLLSEGEYWAEQRARLQPAFFRERIGEYAETMVAETVERSERWAGETVALNEECQRLSLAIMARTLFGFDIERAEGTFGETARTISERFNLSHLSTYLPEWVPTRRNRRYRQALDDLDRVIYERIDERRAEREDESVGAVADGGPTDGGAAAEHASPAADEPDADLLDILVSAADDPETDLTDETLRDEIATVILGGHDTASLAMTYTIYALARHPEAEERVRTELDDVLGDDRPSMTDLPSLPALDRTVREAMRLYPPAYTLFREPHADVEIDGYDVPAGTTVTIPQWVVHRDERWYDDPEQYRPERWTDGFEADLPEYAYFPFGGGKRHCIGMRYGLTETKLVVATLLQRYRFELRNPDLTFSAALTLQPAEDVRVDVRDA